jgi:DNA processing protein
VPLSPSALEPLLRLAVVPGIGPARLQTLLRRFGSAERVLAASSTEINSLPGFGPELVRRVRGAAEPRGLERARAALAMLQRQGAVALTPDDLDYPDEFRRLADPPFLLFAVGDLTLLHRAAVAVVGTRRPTPDGRATAAALSRGLVEAGYVVVSGMASGIDAAAHVAALEARGGTIGVLGHGVERVYPAENRSLFRAVSERGLLLTEYAPGEEPKAGNFPRRNRLVAALSAGVVVVEMGERSGARHTVDAALDLGREVFAVPGPIGSEVSVGTNQLLKQGAAVVTSVEDILEALEGVGALQRPRGPHPVLSGSAAVHGTAAGQAGRGAGEPVGVVPADASPEELRLLSVMNGTDQHVDDLAAAAQLSPGEVLTTLLHLELRGLIESLPGKLFRRL